MGEMLNTITQVEGLLYCMYNGATVINLSCGTNFPPAITSMSIDEQIAFSEEFGKPQEKMWNYVFELAKKRNVTIVWAAGNANCYNAMDASKRNPNTIRVAAVDKNMKRANFSNYGNFADKGVQESTISAPGVYIWGALPNNQYDGWDGTSFSAPIITGVVALMKSINKDLTTEQIINILQSTGKSIPESPEIGKLVQIKDALISAQHVAPSDTTATRN
jgi:subtilisin family serine protease